MKDTPKRALFVIASYDFEGLQITLNALEHTVDPHEKIIIVLNSKRRYYGEIVEVIAREWAKKNPSHRFVVRPLCAGGDIYWAIRELLEESTLLKDVEYFCKIDDDIIPLKNGWLNSLADSYHQLQSQKGNIGFITGLINNNNWGFSELIDIFDKEEEYVQINNHKSRAGNAGNVHINVNSIADGGWGTVWQYPYLARWVHQWTSLQIEEFIRKTKKLKLKEIPQETYYSVGCIFVGKSLWLDQSISKEQPNSAWEESFLHNKCIKNDLTKWAVMSEPIVHLNYYVQRFPNRDLLPLIAESLGRHFNDQSFNDIRWITLEDRLIHLEEKQTPGLLQ